MNLSVAASHEVPFAEMYISFFRRDQDIGMIVLRPNNLYKLDFFNVVDPNCFNQKRPIPTNPKITKKSGLLNFESS